MGSVVGAGVDVAVGIGGSVGIGALVGIGVGDAVGAANTRSVGVGSSVGLGVTGVVGEGVAVTTTTTGVATVWLTPGPEVGVPSQPNDAINRTRHTLRSVVRCREDVPSREQAIGRNPGIS